jgi:copper chaperone CopZ
MLKKTYKVGGMNCDSCAKMLELDFEDEGINAKCSYASEELIVENNNIDKNKIKSILEKSGYSLID